MTLYDYIKLNEDNYAVTYSEKLACKILACDNDWDSLLVQNLAHRIAK